MGAPNVNHKHSFSFHLPLHLHISIVLLFGLIFGSCLRQRSLYLFICVIRTNTCVHTKSDEGRRTDINFVASQYSFINSGYLGSIISGHLFVFMCVATVKANGAIIGCVFSGLGTASARRKTASSP